MSLIEIVKNPNKIELRWFAGLWFPLFWGMIGGIIHTATGTLDASIVIWSTAAALGVCGLIIPSLMRPIFLGMVYATAPIGFVVSHVIMGVVYYVVLTPLGVARRTFGRDPLSRKIERDAETYWLPLAAEKDVTRYYRQS